MEFATQGIFVLVFVLALVDLLRYRDRPRLEVAALFGVLAIAILLGVITDAFGVSVPAADLIGALCIVAQPYLFLRVVDQFRPIGMLQNAVGLVCLAVSWTILLAAGMPVSPTTAAMLVAIFVVVEVVAIVTLVQAVRVTKGVTRQRLVAIIGASGALALAILLAGVATEWSSADGVIEPFTDLLAFGAAIGYYLGFVPPRRLRWLIQMGEFGRLLTMLTNQPAELRLTVVLDYVGLTAARAVGGKAAIVALVSGDDNDLRIHRDPTNRARIDAANCSTLHLGSESLSLRPAWQELRPVVCADHKRFDTELVSLGNAFGGARACLIAPLVVQGAPQGVIIVFVDQRSLFRDDDLNMLALLADHTVTAIESSRLYLAAQHELASRQALLNLSQALAEETDIQSVAERLATDLDTLLPSLSAGVLLPLPNGDLEIAATAGVQAETRRGGHIPLGAGITGRAFASGTPVLVNDVLRDPGYIALRPDTRSELAVPLRYRDTTVGVLNLERTAVDAFGPADVALAQIVATHTAQAIVRAQFIEQLRQQNLDLEAANRHKGEFLANMSHELRTPLNAIIGFSDLLLDDSVGNFNETERHFIKTIRSSGEHLLSLINDILDLAKIEAGHVTLSLERASVQDLVVQALATLRPLADRKGIRLQTEHDHVVDIMCDAGKVKQILYNLLSNAIKFTPDDGIVTVITQQIAEGVRLTVADTGIGISSDDQERVFQEFQQLDAGPGRHYEGTGLGLALTKRFVEMHDGRIWVNSTPGEGSQFHVILPWGPASSAERAIAAHDDIDVATAVAVGNLADDRPLVLIIEDDPHAANLLALYVGRGGYRSSIVADGRQALTQARELRPAAITLDILLPSVDGWEVLRDLKLDPATRDIPVVIASIVDDQELGFALGATDYFVKPVDRQTLLARLDRYTFTTKVQEREVNVLLVDDDPASLELLAGMLTPAGFGVLQATGGADAIAMATERLPDLILLDLMMPDVSGFDVVDVLRTNPATRDTPILIVTAKDLLQEDKQRLNGHVTAILHKGTFGAVDIVSWLDNAFRQMGADTGVSDAT